MTFSRPYPPLLTSVPGCGTVFEPEVLAAPTNYYEWQVTVAGTEFATVSDVFPLQVRVAQGGTLESQQGIFGSNEWVSVPEATTDTFMLPKHQGRTYVIQARHYGSTDGGPNYSAVASCLVSVLPHSGNPLSLDDVRFRAFVGA